ncbi:MAG: transaldolase family protein [Planctomycetota bacterium]
MNAKRLWKANEEFWAANPTPLKQEIIFASTGTKKPEDIAWRYVEALAGSDIETNPPATNDAANASGVTFTRKVDEMPADEILADIDAKIDFAKMEDFLMEEGIKKFVDPQNALLNVIATKRGELAAV